MARACDDECFEFRIMYQIKFQRFIRDHHVYKDFGIHIRGKH